LDVKIGLAQISTKLGELTGNLEKHLYYIEQAAQAGAELVVFPELSLTGYILQDLVSTVVTRPTQDDPIFGKLLKASHDIDIVFGFVDEDRRSRFYIAAAYLSQGEVCHVHRKLYLPTYGLFDEGRFFAAGNTVRAFETRFGRFGMLVCEDFWHASPPYLLWMDGADVMIFISTSPGRGLTDAPQLESARWVEHINQAYASLFTCYVVSTNRVGFEDGIHYWGGATVHDPNGDLLISGPHHEEALTIVDIDLNQLHRTRARLPLLRDERPEIVRNELDLILKKQ
jgi:predicted amidohydrolase